MKENDSIAEDEGDTEVLPGGAVTAKMVSSSEIEGCLIFQI